MVNFADTNKEAERVKEAGQRAMQRTLLLSGLPRSILRAVYPDGVPVDQVGQLPRMVAVVQGLARVAEGSLEDLLHATPWLDVASEALAAHVEAQHEAEEAVSEMDIYEPIPVRVVVVREGEGT